MLNETHHKNLKSWINVPEGSDFPIQNLPYGVFEKKDGECHIGVAIGEHILDLHATAQLGYFDALSFDARTILTQDILNEFMGLGRSVWSETRKKISELLQEGSTLEGHRDKVIFAQSEVKMKMPVKIGDYTDFYSSIEHATNVGVMFRGKDNALMPNWKHLPVGYHGRASSIVVSGQPIKRPHGQRMPKDATTPVFGASVRMDFELEMAFLTGPKTELGDRVPVEKAEDHIFGMVVFNDWSARDIQKWEYVPLGPFLGKNFGSTISPWIVTMEALEPFRVEGPAQDPKPLPYLQSEGKHAFDIHLEVSIQPEKGKHTIVSESNFKHLYWNMAQQLAHQTVNGCNINPGDMYASGTISGPVPESYGSMLELSWNGTKPLSLNGGTMRTFLEDGDTVTMKGWCEKEGLRIGFGAAEGTIVSE